MTLSRERVLNIKIPFHEKKKSDKKDLFSRIL